MISSYLDALISHFSRLPGVGPKSASRIAFHILSMKEDDVKKFAYALVSLKENIKTCVVCGGISDGEKCSICADLSRDTSILCVVEEAKDVITIEKTNAFRGRYHVLGGVISPLDGVGPDDLSIHNLLMRCNNENVKEVILATNPTLEGDATAMYITKELKKINVKVMRISRGLPVGSDLDFADSATVARSFDERIEI